jgi:PAS domain S-box-containing protein
MKILIVDDRKSERILLEIVLKDGGYEVEAAADGADALEKLAAGEFDGIISDILMPVMDGFQFCREVKRNEKWRMLPFIFYSGTYTEEKDAEFARVLGADKLIVKPMEPSALIKLIREVFENGRHRTAAPSMPAVEDETAYFKLYNERLIHRLEEKTTHLEEANQKLQQSESRLRAILDTEPECVMVILPDGKLLEMNAAGLGMLEAEQLAAVKGRDLLGWIIPDHREAFSKLHQGVMRGESATLEFEIVGLKGTHRWVETHAAPLRNQDGEVIALLGVTRDITGRKRTEEALKKNSEQLRALSAHLQQVREEERTHIAREIHDELGQSLTALKMDLVSLGHAGDPKSLGAKIRSMGELIDQTVQTVRRIASELRPGILDDLGIVAALQWQAQEFRKRSGIRCVMTSRLRQVPLEREHATALFRVCQEALTNVARHARATQVQIKLGKKAGAVVLEVRDNGRGITADQMANPKSLGLMGMRERILLLGGACVIGSHAKIKGTKVTVTIPLEKAGGKQ